MKGIEPRDQIETMLAAQMAAVHNARMTSPYASRLPKGSSSRIVLSARSTN